MSEPDSKFSGVPPEQLEKYVAASAQQVGEDDQAWATRVKFAELELLAKYPAPATTEGATLHLEGTGEVTAG
jgi:hypothetical protein